MKEAGKDNLRTSEKVKMTRENFLGRNRKSDKESLLLNVVRKRKVVFVHYAGVSPSICCVLAGSWLYSLKSF